MKDAKVIFDDIETQNVGRGFVDLIIGELQKAMQFDFIEFGMAVYMQRYYQWYDKHVKPLHRQLGIGKEGKC